jgi:hypothetical protein
MVVGSLWESAAFDMEHYTKNYVPQYKKNRKFLLESANTEIPSAETLTSWWQSLSEQWKYVLQMNLYLQRNEIFTRLIHQFLGSYVAIFKNKFPNVVFEEPDAKDLENMIQMKALLGAGAKLDTLEPIRLMKGLQLLELEGNQITDISPLSGLTSLEYLGIYMNKVQSHSPLQHLTKLKYLDFQPIDQNDLESITTLTSLRKIDFNIEGDLDVRFMTNLPNLTKISGCSDTVSEESLIILKEMHQKGVEIYWEDDLGVKLVLDV